MDGFGEIKNMRATTLTFGLLLALSAAQSVNVLDFVDGFIVGIEKDANSPDECATDSQALISGTEAIIADIKAAIAGNSNVFTQLLQDAINLSDDFDSFNGACDFTKLIADLAALTTADGVVALVWRFVDNAKEVGEYVKVLQQCSSNYTDCGTAAGHIFTILVGYQI